jgi:hypothetical protein
MIPRACRLIIAALCAAVGFIPGLHASILISESFDYSVGANLAGQNGGTGFSGPWDSGNSTIVAGFGGSGNAVQIGRVEPAQLRTLSTPTSTAGQSLYFTYLINVSSFGAGNFAGLSLWNNGTNEVMFFGIPWNRNSFGFDARAGNGEADIKTINFTPTTNTTYLFALGLLPSATTGKVDVKLWATSDLGINPDLLVAGTANASLLGTKNNFSFNRFGMNGSYSNSLRLAGIAASTNVSQAAALTVSAVPEPSTYALLLMTGAGALWWARRRRSIARGKN